MSTFITYLALQDSAAVTPSELVLRYRELYGEEAYKISVPASESDVPGDPFVVMMDQMPVTVMFIDQPLLADAYQQALDIDLTWPEAHDVMAAQRAHVIVALLNDVREHLESLNGAAAVTLVAGALADLLPTVAVVSTEGCTLTRPEAFASIAAELAKHQVPEGFWTTVAFTPGEKDSKGRAILHAMTYGLLPFIGREVECFAATVPANIMAGWLAKLSHYLVRQGPVIQDQDLTLLQPEEKVRAIYRPEGLRLGVPVIQYDLDDPHPVEGKPTRAEGQPHTQPHDRVSAPGVVLDDGDTFETRPVPTYSRSRVAFGKRGL